METVPARYARLADAFAAKVEAVPDDGWTNPSPCQGWTALDVVRHVVETPSLFLGFVGRPPVESAPIEGDPAAAFAASRRAVQAELDDPERAAAEFDGFTGRTSFAEAIDRFLCFDLLVHRWDLARATGLDEAIDDHDLQRLEEDARFFAESFGDAMRGPQSFGEAVEPAPDADRQARLLSFLGRRP